MTSFSYFLGNRFVGEFTSPADFPFSDLWLCQHCATIVAKRINQSVPNPVFVFHPLSCEECVPRLEFFYQFVPLRNGFEILAQWEPKALLAEEFLLNSGVYHASNTRT